MLRDKKNAELLASRLPHSLDVVSGLLVDCYDLMLHLEDLLLRFLEGLIDATGAVLMHPLFSASRLAFQHPPS